MHTLPWGGQMKGVSPPLYPILLLFSVISNSGGIILGNIGRKGAVGTCMQIY